jgi:hypothetical protein
MRPLPHRHGAALRLLTKILKGRPPPPIWPNWKPSAYMVQDTSLCGLGQTAPNPVLSTLKYFPEYEELLVTPPIGMAGDRRRRGLNGLQPRPRHLSPA